MEDLDVAKLESSLNSVIQNGEKLLQEIRGGKSTSDVGSEEQTGGAKGPEIQSKYQLLQSSLSDIGEILSKSTNKKSDAVNETEVLKYELKAQVLRNVDVQNSRLKTELSLHERLNEVRHLHTENRRLQNDCTLSRTNALKLMKMFERKAIEANDKLIEMQTRLEKYEQTMKSQSVSDVSPPEATGLGSRQDIHRTGDVGDVGTTSRNKYPIKKSPAETELTLKNSDISKKNETLTADNRELRREAQKLRQDNTDLTRRMKLATSSQHEILCNLNTSESARANLLKKIKKEKQQNERLNRSLKRQTADWVESRRIVQQLEEEYRWEKVGPIPTGGPQFRVPHLPTAKNLYMPRKGLDTDRSSVITA